MGKNHRHSKKLKSEKNKVQIKSKTKFLPKGQNVTNTSFKIKPIVLHEQLKERELSRKKANIDELVTKLKHYNDTVKAESCQELKESITVNPVETTQKYLAAILQNASALIQDRERKVRRASIKLLHTIFEKIPENTIRPFFTYILTNLKCAMTNINKHIQEDSLLLLDAVLEHQSVLIAEHFDDFFLNFLLLISKLKGQTTERSLSLNLEGKVTSVKWRVKVLTRLYGILNAMVQKRDRNTDKRSPKVAPVTVQAKNTFFVPIYKNIAIYENTDFMGVSQNQDCTQFDGHILNLTQLLHEIWMEVLPDKAANSSVLASEESVAIFSCIVNILRLLHEYVNPENDEIFAQNKSKAFLQNLLSNFPYSHNLKNLAIAKDFPKCFVLNHDQNCLEENLLIIYIHTKLKTKNLKNNRKVTAYLNNCLKSQNRFNSTSFSYLIKILKEILSRGANHSELIENVATFYSKGKIPEKHKSEILEILTTSNESWMEKLPDFLCQRSVSAKLIDRVLDLCRKGHKSVQDGVKNSLTQILGNLANLEISDGDVEVAQKNIASIFFYLDLSREDIEEIKRFISNADLNYCEYFRNVLELRTFLLK